MCAMWRGVLPSRTVVDELHVRCRACQRWFAGWLVEVPALALVRIERDGVVTYRTPALHAPRNAYAASADELVLCAAWCRVWARDADVQRQSSGLGVVWDPAWTPEELARVDDTLEPAGAGCCGPVGALTCACGVRVGRIEGDCADLGVLYLSRAAIDTSTHVDGEWNLGVVLGERTTAGAEREIGAFRGGRRDGEWATYRDGVLVDLVVYAGGAVVTRA